MNSPLFEGRDVLLVEDNEVIGELMVMRLQRLFGTVRWALSGTEGAERYSEQRPDLLIVDQLLPGMNGSELVALIRKTDRELKIIGITASAMGEEIAELEAAGANVALEKPISLADLRTIAANLLQVQI